MRTDRARGNYWHAIVALGLLLGAVVVILVPAGPTPPSPSQESAEEQPGPELEGRAIRVEAARGRNALTTTKSEAADVASNSVIVGDVVAAATGVGIANATVTAFPSDQTLLEDLELVVSTDAQGAFRIELKDAPRGEAPWALEVRHPAYIRSQVQVAPGDKERAKIEMREGAVLSGTVTDDAGVPIGGARVVARIRGNRLAWPLVENVYRRGPYGGGGVATTDEQGKYSITSVSPEEAYTVSASKWLHTSLGKVLKDVRPARAGAQDLVLHPVAGLRLECVDSVSDKVITTVGVPHRVPDGCWPQTYHPVQTHYGSSPNVRSDQTYIQFIRAPSQRQAVDAPVVVTGSCQSPGYEEAEFSVELTWGQVTSRVVKMDRRSATLPSGSLEVRAIWPDDTPYEGPLRFRLSGSSNKSIELNVRTGSDGRAPPLALPAEDYKLQLVDFQTGRWWPAEPHITPVRVRGGESTPQTIRLPGAMIPLRIVAADGEEIRDFGLGIDSIALEGEPWSENFGTRFYTFVARFDLTRKPFVLVPLGKLKLFVRLEGEQEYFVVDADVSTPGVQELLVVKLPK